MTSSFALAMESQFESALAMAGETLRYVPKGRTAPGEIEGVWSEPGLAVDLGEAGLRSTQPSLSIRLADAPLCRKGDELWRAGATWRVVDIDPDGDGAARLSLSRVSPAP